MYQISLATSAVKDLRQLSKPIIRKISVTIDSLAVNPRPFGCKKLKDSTENLWRVRVGDYRIIYVIEDDIHIIDIRRTGTGKMYINNVKKAIDLIIPHLTKNLESK